MVSSNPVSRRAVLGLGAAAAGVGGLYLLSRPEVREPDPRAPKPRRHAYGEDPRQVGDLYRPREESRGTVVVLHGGFWQDGYDLSLNSATSADLAQHGWTVWNLDYRAVGGGGGWPETFDDVRAGIAHLAALDVAVDDTIALGHSAGGHLAVWVAGEEAGPVRVTAAVPMAGVLDLVTAARNRLGGSAVQALLGGGPDEVPRRYRLADPLVRVPLGIPVRCVHGSADSTVPISQSRAYVEAARAAGDDARLVETPGGHFDALDPSTAMWRRTRALVRGLGSAG